jgi:kinetochore protein Nuf2
MAKQLANAREKIERAQQHIEDKRIASQQAIERLEKEYQYMAIERRDTDKHNEELRAEADEIERKVSPHPPNVHSCNTLTLAPFHNPCPDGR